MKLPCEIMEDLLPLYEDNVCSDQSKRAVEEHLLECERCRKLIENTHKIPILNIEPEKPAADKVVAKSFRKIRQRWWVSVLLILIIVPLVFLGWNQYHTEGVHFTNIYEMQIGKAFMEQLQKGNYTEAYKYIDIEGKKQEWLEEWFDEEKLVNMEEDGLAKFCEYGAKLEEIGGIQSYEYLGISLCAYDDELPIYRMFYKIQVAGKNVSFLINVSNDGIESFSGGGSFLNDPLAQFSIWSEYLWQDYAGCYFDPDLKQYVYYNTN